MPLSFRRSYRKKPGVDLDKNKRLLGKVVGTRVVRPSEKFRPTKYPLIIPIGCGAAIGLCIFMLFTRGLIRIPWVRTATLPDYAAIATSAFETALADQLGTLAAPQPTASPSPQATPTATSTLPPIVELPLNPWTADMPDAACIPPDLPQTGRVVEVVDGDTIKVLMDSDGHVYSVHYLGAEAPAAGSGSDTIALEAMARNTELVYRKQAVLVRDITDSDLNGTLLRYVMVDKVFVNHALVAAGLARADLTAPDAACMITLRAAEQQAQAGGLGMWSGLQTLAPTFTATP